MIFTFTKVANGAKMASCSTNVKVAARCRLNISVRRISQRQNCQMKRDEFSPKTKDQAAQRANGVCEYCHLPFAGERPEFHHILEATYGGKATLANCLVVHKKPCHAILTAEAAGPRAKADRQRRAATGAERAKQAIPSRPKTPKPPPKPKAPQRRDVFNREI